MLNPTMWNNPDSPTQRVVIVPFHRTDAAIRRGAREVAALVTLQRDNARRVYPRGFASSRDKTAIRQIENGRTTCMEQLRLGLIVVVKFKIPGSEEFQNPPGSLIRRLDIHNHELHIREYARAFLSRGQGER